MNLSFLKKFKYKEIKIRYVVLIIVAAVIFRYWGESSITMLQKDVPLVTETELSTEEINRYIQTKQAYIEENIFVSPDIIVSRDLEDYLDTETHEWFLLHGWRPVRFFYAEERIRQILDLIDSQNRQINEAIRLENEADNALNMRPDDVKDSQIDKSIAEKKNKANTIRYYIDREIRQAGISEQEEQDVRAYLDELYSLARH